MAHIRKSSDCEQRFLSRLSPNRKRRESTCNMCRADFSCENFARNQIFLVTVEALLVTTLVSDQLQLRPGVVRPASLYLPHSFQFEIKPSNFNSAVQKTTILWKRFQSHVGILIYQAWAIDVQIDQTRKTVFNHISTNKE